VILSTHGADDGHSFDGFVTCRVSGYSKCLT